MESTKHNMGFVLSTVAMLNEKSQESVANPALLTILGLDRSGLARAAGVLVAGVRECPEQSLLANASATCCLALVCLLACLPACLLARAALLGDLGRCLGEVGGERGAVPLHSIPFQLHETNFG